MKQSIKVLLYGLLGALFLITLCIYFHLDEFLAYQESQKKISVEVSNGLNKKGTEIPAPPIQPFNLKEASYLKPALLQYVINEDKILIDGRLPILEDTDSLKVTLMEHCQTFKCERPILFTNEQSYPVWSEFVQKMVAFFHDENLTHIGITVDEHKQITLQGELTDVAVQAKLQQMIEQEGIAYSVKNDTVFTPPKVIEPVPIVDQVVTPAVTKPVVDPIEEAQRQVSEIIEQEQIHFERNRARITKKSQKTLDKIIQIVKDIPDSTIVVNGYTDASGKRAINRWISQERAKSVKNYLGSKGLNPKNIKAQGYGETHLLYVDKPYSQLNRRVEIIIKRR